MKTSIFSTLGATFIKFIAKINHHPLISQSIDKIRFQLFKQQCKFFRHNSKKVLHRRIFDSSTGEFSTTVFEKETDCQAYLHRKSEYPEPLKRIIPYAQALRLKLKILISRLIVTFCRKKLLIDDMKRLKYMIVYQKHLTEAGKTY